MVEYDNIVSDDKKQPLIEITNIFNVRPLPPPRGFSVHEEVDAFCNDGYFKGAWFTATVRKMIGKSKVMDEYDNIVSDDKKLPLVEITNIFNVRPLPPPHDSLSMRKSTLSAMMAANSFKVAWFTATVRKIIGKSKVMVEYDNIVSDDKKQPLDEFTNIFNVRPLPPPHGFFIYEEVDTFCNDGWWAGVNTKNVKEMIFLLNQLRVHQDFVDGHCVMPSSSQKLLLVE
ncbi:hypothetical protein AMTRI_Chr07g27140 [Amborella trichopoda]